MKKPDVDKLLQTEMTRKQFLAFSAFAVASVFGFVGLLKMFASHAATPTAGFEAEDGTVSGPAASIVTDTAASGGAAIAFGTVANTFVLGTTKPVATIQLASQMDSCPSKTVT